jgi:putative endonuclease
MNEAKRQQAKSCGWCLYILQCSDGTFYTGITNDLVRRLKLHNSGTASRYTRSRTPVTVIYKEACRSKSSALKKECRIKALTRKEKEEYICNCESRPGFAAKRRQRRKEI